MCSPLLPPRLSRDIRPLTSPPQLTNSPPPEHNSRSSHVNMSWQEEFDFSYHIFPGSYPFGSSPSPFERMSSLERDCCSNFTCCGLHLSDLHSLLEHFEEAHVVVIDNAGNPVLPRTRVAADFDNFHLSSTEIDHQTDYPTAYPYTSFVYGYPQLDPQPTYAPNQPQDQYQPRAQSEPVSPIEVESPTPYASFPLRTFLEHEHAIEDPDSLADLDAFSSRSDDTLSSPTSDQPLALPPASFVTGSPIRRGDFEHHPRKSYKSRILGTKPRPQLRRREKAHKCPTPGCLKSYLNPNGLKYHVEKGTCKIEPLYSISD